MSFTQCLVRIYFMYLYPYFNLGWWVQNSGVWKARGWTCLLQRQLTVWQTQSLHGLWAQKASYSTYALLEFSTFRRTKSSRQFLCLYFHFDVNSPLLIILTFTTVFCHCISHENIPWKYFTSLLLSHSKSETALQSSCLLQH